LSRKSPLSLRRCCFLFLSSKAVYPRRQWFETFQTIVEALGQFKVVGEAPVTLETTKEAALLYSQHPQL
jgi:hypothetical protein